MASAPAPAPAAGGGALSGSIGGVPKKAILVVGVLVLVYVYMRSRNSASSATPQAAGVNGLSSATNPSYNPATDMLGYMLANQLATGNLQGVPSPGNGNGNATSPGNTGNPAINFNSATAAGAGYLMLPPGDQAFSALNGGQWQYLGNPQQVQAILKANPNATLGFMSTPGYMTAYQTPGQWSQMPAGTPVYEKVG